MADMKKLVIFDLDGTLTNTVPDIEDNENKTMTWTIGEMKPNTEQTLTYRVKLGDNYTYGCSPFTNKNKFSNGSIVNTAAVSSKIGENVYPRGDDTVTFEPVVRTKQSVCETTRFTKYFSGNGGVSSYSGTLKELYQDYTGSSVFCGKGLVNSRLLHEKLTGVFKEETVLSHDIPEGEILVTKFVSDTEVAEGFPKTEISYFKRLDRWIRGNIQNIAALRNFY